MKKQFVILFVLCACNLYAQQGWFQQASGTSSNLTYLQFLNSTTGFTCGTGGALLKTTNSGANWSLILTNLGQLRDVQFLNTTTGFAWGDSGISRTTNGGVNWLRIGGSGVSGYFHFIDINTGYTANAGGFCQKTTNGGSNWQQLGIISGPGGTTNFVYLNDANMYVSGWYWVMQFGGLYYAQIYKSTNGGINWSIPYSSPVYGGGGTFVSDISFPNSVHGFAVGQEESIHNYFYNSTNSGLNWSKDSIPTQMNSLCFADNSTGWLVGTSGGIYYTTNAGLNFSSQISGVAINLRRIFMVNNTTGWIIGDNGIILSTTNGGITSAVPVGTNIPEKFSLYQNYPNPFNPGTKIKFDVPNVVNGRDRSLRLVIYDALGREVATLVNEQLQPGTYEVEWDGANYPSGVYFYKLETQDFSQTKKLVLIK